MKRINIISLIIAGGIFVLAACHSEPYRKEGNIYVPDMHYSRAYDTYTENPLYPDHQTSREPVKGTIKRGAMLPYHVPESDSGYAYSGAVPNPLHVTDSILEEGKRLFDIYCAICHGEKLDGNGPLYQGGSGPYIAAPANFIAGPKSTLPAGTIFYVATYGIRNMGSYASQLNKRQRWMVVSYIKSVQREKGSTVAMEDSTMQSMVSAYLQTK